MSWIDEALRKLDNVTAMTRKLGMADEPVYSQDTQIIRGASGPEQPPGLSMGIMPDALVMRVLADGWPEMLDDPQKHPTGHPDSIEAFAVVEYPGQGKVVGPIRDGSGEYDVYEDRQKKVVVGGGAGGVRVSPYNAWEHDGTAQVSAHETRPIADLSAGNFRGEVRISNQGNIYPRQGATMPARPFFEEPEKLHPAHAKEWRFGQVASGGNFMPQTGDEAQRVVDSQPWYKGEDPDGETSRQLNTLERQFHQLQPSAPWGSLENQVAAMNGVRKKALELGEKPVFGEVWP